LGDVDMNFIIDKEDINAWRSLFNGDGNLTPLTRTVMDVDRNGNLDETDDKVLQNMVNGNAPTYTFYWDDRSLVPGRYIIHEIPEDTKLVGDLDGDWDVDVHDYVFLEDWIKTEINPETLTPLVKGVMDTNQDGKISNEDLTALVKIMNGKAALYTVGESFEIDDNFTQKMTFGVKHYLVRAAYQPILETYVLGDLTGDFKVNADDYSEIQSWLSGEFDSLGAPLFDAIMDMDRNGLVTAEDLEEVDKTIKGKISLYAFDWHSESETAVSYYIMRNAGTPEQKKMYLIGDLDFNMEVNSDDYELMLDYLESDTDEYNPLTKVYIRDVDRDGVFTENDLPALESIVRGLAPIYAFYWDEVEEETGEYFRYGYQVKIRLIGDIDCNMIIDREDYDLIADYISYPFGDVLFQQVYDVNMDGELSEDDLAALEDIIKGLAPIYAYTISDVDYEIGQVYLWQEGYALYIVGDVNLDRVIDRADYNIMADSLSGPTTLVGDPVRPFIVDVNFDGVFNDTDLEEMNYLIDGGSSIYAFYWDAENLKPLRYIVYEELNLTGAPTGTKDFLVGDIDDDKAVDYQDYVLLKDWLDGGGAEFSEPYQKYLFDVDRNGTVDSNDQAVLYDVVSGLARTYGFRWDFWNHKFERYFIQKAVEPSAFIVGDIDFDKKLTKADYDLLEGSLRDTYVTVENAGDNLLRDFYLLDVDRDGYVSSYDLVHLKDIIDCYYDSYAFYWNYETQTAYDSFVYEKAKGEVVYLVGDINKDGEVNYNDRALLKDFLKMDVRLWENWSLLDSIYTRDVNMDGVVTQEDVTAMEDVVNGLAELYAFYWDNFNQVPKEYFRYADYPPADRTYILGDINKDGELDYLDYDIMEERLFGGGHTLEGDILRDLTLDMNRDKVFDQYDLALLDYTIKGLADSYKFIFIDSIHTYQLWEVTEYILYEKAETPKTYILGDLNSDGKISGVDYKIAEHRLSGVGLNLLADPVRDAKLDMNRDGLFNRYDLEILEDTVNGFEDVYEFTWVRLPDDYFGKPGEYILYEKAKNHKTYILGDLNYNTELDEEDIKNLQDYVDGLFSSIPDEFLITLMDINRNGDVDENDISVLRNMLDGNAESYAFYWDSENKAPLEYYVYQGEKGDSYIVGDVNFDGLVDNVDYDLMEESFESFINDSPDEWNPLEDIYIRDVNRNGKFDLDDFAVLEDIIDGIDDIYAFYWNADNKEPCGYYVYQNIDSSGTYLVGDFNFDNIIDNADGQLWSKNRYYLTNPIKQLIADIDMNGTVDIADSQALKDIINGIASINGFTWNVETSSQEYFVYKEVDLGEPYIEGDINLDGIVDITDYNIIKEMYETNAEVDSLTKAIIDFSTDGEFDNRDVSMLMTTLQGRLKIYAFYWDSENEKALGYFVYKEAEEDVKYILGDVNQDGEVNNADYDLMKYRILNTIVPVVPGSEPEMFILDVDKDGYFGSSDLAALDLILRGKKAVYYFTWNYVDLKPRQYSVHKKVPTLYGNRIDIETRKVEVFTNDDETVTAVVPLAIISDTRTKGFTAYIRNAGEISDISLKQNDDFPFTAELTSCVKMSDGTYKIMVTYEEKLPVYFDTMSKLPNVALTLIITLPLKDESYTADINLYDIVLIKDDGVVLTDLPIKDSSAQITIANNTVTLGGDLNNDGTLSLSDLVMLYQYIGGTRNLTPYQLAASDIDNDRIVNASDLTIFKRKFLSR
jgi:hypothetical protein